MTRPNPCPTGRHAFWRTPRRGALAVLALLALTACREDLYTGLDEGQANELVAVLAASDIAAWRERDKKGVYAVRVDGPDVAQAIGILQARGLPREKFQALGDVFTAEGIVGTPFEQQARFNHAMNQELSGMITSISGIKSARVLVTAPPVQRYQREAPRATASVVVHHGPDFATTRYASTIKSIVSHSMPDLEYEDVAVAFFPVGGPVVVETAAATPAAVPRSDDSRSARAFMVSLWHDDTLRLGGGLLLVVSLGLLVLGLRQAGPRRGDPS